MKQTEACCKALAALCRSLSLRDQVRPSSYRTKSQGHQEQSLAVVSFTV